MYCDEYCDCVPWILFYVVWNTEVFEKKKQDLSRYRRFIEYLLFRVTRVLYDVTGENSEKEILVLFFFFFTNIKYTNM